MTATREVRTRADWDKHHSLALHETLSHVAKGVNCLRESQATLQTKFAESAARIEKGVEQSRNGNTEHEIRTDCLTHFLNKASFLETSY
jgi:hypothetical protein